jgi:hypothetical protein
MSIGSSSTVSVFSFVCGALMMVLLPGDSAAAQQYLGNARQRCQGPVTVTTAGGSLQVRPFEARSAEVSTSNVQWQCPDQPQPGQIQCPPNTNKVLIDRSQGGSIFSIICLQK